MLLLPFAERQTPNAERFCVLCALSRLFFSELGTSNAIRVDSRLLMRYHQMHENHA